MIGLKKASTLRAELREAFAKAKMDMAWFDREIRRLERARPPRKVAIETLQSLRRLLTNLRNDKAGPRKKPVTKRHTRRSPVIDQK